MKTRHIVKRIRCMENLMDEVIYAFEHSKNFHKSKRMSENVKRLTEYMDSGTWLSTLKSMSAESFRKSLNAVYFPRTHYII